MGRGTTAVAALLALAIPASASNAAPAPAPKPVVAIEARAQTFGGVPLVYRSVTPRVPMPSMVLRLVGEPALPPSAPVHWSAPDGKNVVGPFAGIGSDEATSTGIDATAADAVAVSPRGTNARGSAIVVADVGGTVRQRATILVRDVAGISFGCYLFTTAGSSVRFTGDVGLRSSRAEADVAVVGPGRPEGGGPAPECGGENYEPGATSYRLVFGKGGRVLRFGRTAFVRELPPESLDEGRPLDVQTHEGGVVRLHVSPAAGGAYYVGWAESLDGTLPG